MTQWEELFLFMIRFSFISLIGYAIGHSLLKLFLTNYFGGKLAIASLKENKD
jgi:hypothetical protein